jgi:hypothetical protein
MTLRALIGRFGKAGLSGLLLCCGIREPIVGGSGQISGLANIEDAKGIASCLSTGGAKLTFEVSAN